MQYLSQGGRGPLHPDCRHLVTAHLQVKSRLLAERQEKLQQKAAKKEVKGAEAEEAPAATEGAEAKADTAAAVEGEAPAATSRSVPSRPIADC